MDEVIVKFNGRMTNDQVGGNSLVFCRQWDMKQAAAIWRFQSLFMNDPEGCICVVLELWNDQIRRII